MNIGERRQEIRLALPECTITGPRGGSGRILDLSSAGVGVEIGTQCLFARGELHRLVLSDLVDFVEVEGTVCWTRSIWRQNRESRTSQYFQSAGFQLSRLLTREPSGIWPSLLADLPPAPIRLEPVEISSAEALVAPVSDMLAADPVTTEEAATPEVSNSDLASRAKPPELRLVESLPATLMRPSPPLKMLEPADGSTVSQDSIRVICIIEDPEAVSGVKINGVNAMVMKDMGTASVKLDRGMNRILSMVHRSDGSYSTYLLGKIQRTSSN